MTIQVIKMQGGENTKNININDFQEETVPEDVSVGDSQEDESVEYESDEDESNEDESNEDESNEDESNEDESNEDESNEDESNEDESNEDESNENESVEGENVLNGGAGAGDSDTVSSVSTTEILGKYPLFLVLTEFLMDDEGNNIVHVLHDINKNLSKIAKRLTTLQQSSKNKK
jgi:hypothetical protein